MNAIIIENHGDIRWMRGAIGVDGGFVEQVRGTLCGWDAIVAGWLKEGIVDVMNSFLILTTPEKYVTQTLRVEWK